MTKSDLELIFDQFTADNRSLLFKKNADYAHDDTDVVANFKRHAKDLNTTELFVWRVYAGKHFDSITRYCCDGHVESEEIYGRIQDMSNYLVLLLAIIKDIEARKDEGGTASGPFSFCADSGHYEPRVKAVKGR